MLNSIEATSKNIPILRNPEYLLFNMVTVKGANPKSHPKVRKRSGNAIAAEKYRLRNATNRQRNRYKVNEWFSKRLFFAFLNNPYRRKREKIEIKKKKP